MKHDLPVPKRNPPAPRRVDDLLDLPSVAGDLPAPVASLPVVSVGLPSPAASLPVAAANLPSVAASLPVAAANLPVPAGSLPVPAASLPSVAGSLPVPAASLPVARGFGEIDLPNVADALPSVLGTEQQLPVHAGASGGGGFGEIELPGERPVSRSPVPDSADFGDLRLDDKPRSGRSGHSVVTRAEDVGTSSHAAGAGDAMGFGEVDLGGGASPGGHAIGVDTSGATHSRPPPDVGVHAAATAPDLRSGRLRGTARASCRGRPPAAEVRQARRRRDLRRRSSSAGRPSS